MAAPDWGLGPVDFPTLLVAGDWIERHCVVPDGFDEGKPFLLVDWQALYVLNHYRVRPEAQPGGLAPAFHFRRSQVVLPQKAGKAPITAAQICLEGVGPALFGGWATGDEAWVCQAHGCDCGWVYEYEPGEAMARQWPTPLIQLTATSKEQTDNVYDALRPMIDNGPLHQLIPKTGEKFIRLPGRGRIDTVTSSAKSRLGQRVTFVPQDETGIWTPDTGMVSVAETQRRGAAGMGGRVAEFTNAWDPAQQSVAQRTAESKASDIFRLHPLPPEELDYLKPADRAKIHAHVYAGSPWVDQRSIEAEAAELIEKDPAQAERFFGNRVRSGTQRAFDTERWHGLTASRRKVRRREWVTLGFDGAMFHDATALVATHVRSGHQWPLGIWEDPGVADWQVDEADVDATVEEAFSTWRVWRMYADPPYWQDWVATWQGRYGTSRVIAWWTNRYKPMAWAIDNYLQAVRDGALSHDGDERMAAHIGNAQRRYVNVKDPQTGRQLFILGKEDPESPLKIDAAMAGCLSWEARSDAVKAGLLKKGTGGTAAI